MASGKKIVPSVRSFSHGKPIILPEKQFPVSWKVKWCYKCRTFKQRKEFYNDNSKWDGKDNICAVCANEKRARLYRKAKDKADANGDMDSDA